MKPAISLRFVLLFLTPIEVASACDFIRKLEEELKKNAKARETRKSEKAQVSYVHGLRIPFVGVATHTDI